MNGYIHMLRNSGNSQGICGINMLASYPTKTSPNPPPPPPPGPTKCDLFTQCAAGETCCCTHRIFGICFSWKCCELNSAVCCKDNQHCCPHDYPVCDTKKSQCYKVGVYELNFRILMIDRLLIDGLKVQTNEHFMLAACWKCYKNGSI